jgi:hypothetical protein
LLGREELMDAIQQEPVAASKVAALELKGNFLFGNDVLCLLKMKLFIVVINSLTEGDSVRESVEMMEFIVACNEHDAVR